MGQASPLKRSLSLIPSSPQVCGADWLSQDDLGGRQAFDHAPLSPQSSVASSGSEQTEDQGSRNTFQEDGSGMKGQEVNHNTPGVQSDHIVGIFSGKSHDMPTATALGNGGIAFSVGCYRAFQFCCLRVLQMSMKNK